MEKFEMPVVLVLNLLGADIITESDTCLGDEDCTQDCIEMIPGGN